ncbi:catechol 2,3-dioxygenase-like lactoylglutathione lyase family enzyme [Rhizobium leguminosarum]|uniref:Catechol 2,3-dioxygenase-like lactoylglutathione lyase family enzyme n=2 Tax=Rhizobium leguminosarum TaxID=384 RepID=A0A7X0DTE9_RHILE|nr:catechol 2,3-dioxygenase-like lactoylglutathione lyase family enzyme [Rhizobium leguminosarum]
MFGVIQYGFPDPEREEKIMSVYATVGAIDSAKSNAFYNAVLAVIGWSKHQEFPGWCAYSEGGRGEGFVLWVCQPFNGEAASAGNGSMIGFMAKSRAEVDAFYGVAMASGAVDEGAPGARPHYGPNWYAAYMRDPAGNKIAIVFNG